MKELSLREIQLVEFEVLKKLKELCEKLNLRYYLFYGTLLGAVRHQGFIPWDDDIDIGMFHEDYEKFLHRYGGTNGEVDDAMVIIRRAESGEFTTIEFLEDIRD